MRVKEVAAGSRRVAQQQCHSAVAGHGASSGLEHRLWHAGGLVGHQHHVVAVDTLQCFWLLGPGGTRRDEHLVGCGVEHDAVLLDRHHVLQRCGHHRHPALEFGEHGVEQLRAGRCRDHHLHRRAGHEVPQHRPARPGGLTHTVPRADGDFAVAACDGSQELDLPLVGVSAQDLLHKKHRIIVVSLDPFLKDVFCHSRQF